MARLNSSSYSIFFKRIVLFLALLIPSIAQAQYLDAWIWATRANDGWYQYYVGSNSGPPVQIVSISLNFCPGGDDWVRSPRGWYHDISWNARACSVLWIALEGYEIPPGQQSGDFYLWGPPNDAWVRSQVVGVYWPDAMDVKFAEILGHGAW